MPEVATHLLRVGFDDVRGYLEGGMDAWETAGYPLATLATLSVHELAAAVRGDGPSGRSCSTCAPRGSGTQATSTGRMHIHGGKLQERFAEVPRDRPVAVVCGSGYRGLDRRLVPAARGLRGVGNVIGGMTAWKAAGLPTVKD